MKNVICVLLMGALVAPVMSQRVKHGKKHVEAVHKKADVKKGCPKCNSLKKELEDLKKRVARARMGSKKGGSSTRGRRGSVGRSKGRGSRGSTTRRSRPQGVRKQSDEDTKRQEAIKKMVERFRKGMISA